MRVGQDARGKRMRKRARPALIRKPGPSYKKYVFVLISEDW